MNQQKEQYQNQGSLQDYINEVYDRTAIDGEDYELYCDHCFRACVDNSVIGYYSSKTKAKRVLTVKKIKAVGGAGADGYIDIKDPTQEDGWRCLMHRVTGYDAGWYYND